MWEACRHIGVRPPGVKEAWDDNSPWQQALIIAFYQRHVHDHNTAHKEASKPSPKPPQNRGGRGRRGGRSA